MWTIKTKSKDLRGRDCQQGMLITPFVLNFTYLLILPKSFEHIFTAKLQGAQRGNVPKSSLGRMEMYNFFCPKLIFLDALNTSRYSMTQRT